MYVHYLTEQPYVSRSAGISLAFACNLRSPLSHRYKQAKEEFLRWQRRRRLHLAPSSLLSEGTYDLKAGMLPFWLFSVRARVEYRGSVGVPGGWVVLQLAVVEL